MNVYLNKWGKDKVSISTVRRLVIRYCGHSFKKKVIVNVGKTTDFMIKLRE